MSYGDGLCPTEQPGQGCRFLVTHYRDLLVPCTSPNLHPAFEPAGPHFQVAHVQELGYVVGYKLSCVYFNSMTYIFTRFSLSIVSLEVNNRKATFHLKTILSSPWKPPGQATVKSIEILLHYFPEESLSDFI